MSLNQIDEELKEKIQNLRRMQTNLEHITNQRVEMETNLRETELAIEELEKTEESQQIYKSIGGIMVKSTKDKLLPEKKSDKQSLEMKIKTLKQKEERTRNQIQKLSQKLQQEIQQQRM
jgi:prefoldin beta subunit